jgi:CheY-like chemotaxis protein
MKTLALINEKDTSPPLGAAPILKPEPRDAPVRKRILIADDDASVRESLARVLEGENHEVVLAGSGREAVSQFVHAAPDLVLLDLNMPDTDGWQAFELMEKRRPFVPVIVITARPHQYEHAARLGIDAFMEKPLDFPLLLQTIARLLSEPEPERLQRLTQHEAATSFLVRRAAAGRGVRDDH